MNLTIYNNVINKLQKSKFRSSFKLKQKDIDYINEKGMSMIKRHAVDFINQKLAPANPENDGKQTPMKNHPVFIAMHACACCCRTCLYKWHKIPMNKELTKDEKNYIYGLLIYWITLEYKKHLNHMSQAIE